MLLSPLERNCDQRPVSHRLCDVASWSLSKLTGAEKHRVVCQLHRPLTVATACSGTDVPVVCLYHIARALGQEANMHHVFSCEHCPKKQDSQIPHARNTSQTTQPPTSQPSVHLPKWQNMLESCFLYRTRKPITPGQNEGSKPSVKSGGGGVK